MSVTLEPCEGRVILTFDDGLACLSEYALPELQTRHWAAIVFLIPSAMGGRDNWDVRVLGRPKPMMTWDEARRWAGFGIEFGSHSMTHPDLTLLSPRALAAELADSRAMSEDKLGKAVRYLSYPYGRHSERVRQAARDAGYQAAFAITPSAEAPSNPFAIPRLMVGGLTTLREVSAALRESPGEGPWTGPASWKRRFVHSLNAGSATVSAWRRARLQGQVLTGDANRQMRQFDSKRQSSLKLEKVQTRQP